MAKTGMGCMLGVLFKGVVKNKTAAVRMNFINRGGRTLFMMPRATADIYFFNFFFTQSCVAATRTDIISFFPALNE